MNKISFIIPCYNVDQTLINRCINSILNQDYKDFEILIIDDGSKDNYARILDDIAKSDYRIKIFHQKNMGVSIARNTGVSLASGKYITFVDADDTITEHFLDEAVPIVNKENPDIIYAYTYRGFSEYKRKDTSEISYKDISEVWLRDRYFKTYNPVNDKSFGRGPYSRLLTKELAEKVSFIKGVPIGEDVLWNLELLTHAKKKILVDRIWYNYLYSKDSVTSKFTPNIQDKLKPFYKEVTRYIDESEQSQSLFISRIAFDYTHYILGLYVGHPSNKTCFLKKCFISVDISKEEPWNKLREVTSKKNIINHLDLSTKLKIYLLRFNILFPLWYIKNLLKK